jgi:hypothetical protein
MQRVRIGLTGLAFVFVLVLLAAIFVRPSQDPRITENSIQQQQSGALPADPDNGTQPKEPLAELGVAPGNADDNGAAGTVPPSGDAAQK